MVKYCNNGLKIFWLVYPVKMMELSTNITKYYPIFEGDSIMETELSFKGKFYKSCGGF